MSDGPSGATRRTLLSGAGAVLATGGLLAAGCGATTNGKRAVKQAPPAVEQADVVILSQALALERRTIAAYTAAIPLLSDSLIKGARDFVDEELQHTGALIALIKAAGAKAPDRAASYDIGRAADQGQALAVLHELERLQISSYLSWIPRLSPGPVRAAVSSILACDAQHVAMLRRFQGQPALAGPLVTGRE